MAKNLTISTGAHNIRKLYMREALNITGGALTINYDPTYASNPAYPNAARSGPNQPPTSLQPSTRRTVAPLCPSTCHAATSSMI